MIERSQVTRRARRAENGPPRRPVWKRVMLSVAFALVGLCLLWAGSSILVFYRSLTGGHPGDGANPGPQLGPGRVINILALGLDAQLDANGKPIPDWRHSHGRADTVMLISFDVKTHRVSVLSLPRDSRVPIPGHGFDKLNAAHAYGGPQLAMRTVEQLTGVPIHYYVRTSFPGVARAVDILDGVEFDVPQNMNYEDPYQNLYIHLKAGRQVLNGDKAVQLLRFRQYPDGDITRIKVQQQFLRAMAAKALSATSLARLPFLVDDVMACVDTNIPPSKVLSLARLGLGLNPEEVPAAVAPGQPRDIGGVSYWVLDEAGLAKAVREVVYGLDQPVRVEVLNASGQAGLATRAATILKKQGFSVVSVGNAPSRLDRTVIRAPSEQAHAGEAVAAALSGMVSKPEIQVPPSPNQGADVTVLLADDVSVTKE